jgi:hypothetical protein
MLTPARRAIALVLNPSNPSVSKTCAAASMIDITDRDCPGALRIFNGDGLETLGMETSAEKMRSGIEECVQKSERVLISTFAFPVTSCKARLCRAFAGC